jgi:hypothetical protein
VAKPKPSAPAKKPEKRLSRLEQLRLQKQEQMKTGGGE